MGSLFGGVIFVHCIMLCWCGYAYVDGYRGNNGGKNVYTMSSDYCCVICGESAGQPFLLSCVDDAEAPAQCPVGCSSGLSCSPTSGGSVSSQNCCSTMTCETDGTNCVCG